MTTTSSLTLKLMVDRSAMLEILNRVSSLPLGWTVLDVEERVKNLGYGNFMVTLRRTLDPSSIKTPLSLVAEALISLSRTMPSMNLDGYIEWALTSEKSSHSVLRSGSTSSPETVEPPLAWTQQPAAMELVENTISRDDALRQELTRETYPNPPF